MILKWDFAVAAHFFGFDAFHDLFDVEDFQVSFLLEPLGEGGVEI